VLPYYNKFTAEELRTNLEGCLAQIPLPQLLSDATRLVEMLEKGIVPNSERSISKGTVTNYRSALLRFFNWMYTQGWEDSIVNSQIPEQAPSIYNNQTSAKSRSRGRQFNIKPYSLKPYSLKEEELTKKLKEQLDQLQEFWTNPKALNHKESRLKQTTFRAYRHSILCILGWHKNIQEVDLCSLELAQVADLEQLKAFIDWGIQRGNGIGWAINMTVAGVAVVKWLFSQKPGNGKSNPVKELQNYLQVLRKQYHSEALDKDSAKEEKYKGVLTFEEGVQVVEYLRQCCAPRHKSGTTRSESAVLKSWQRYLLMALLIYSPCRQAEIRRLDERSLFRKQDGYWVQSPPKFKTGSNSAIGKEFLLPNLLTEDLDKWLKDLRSQIKTEHNFVFIRTGSGRVPESLGQPLTARDTSDLVSTAIYQATSVLFETPKRGTPHVFRNSTISYLGQLGRLEHDRLAELTKGQISPELWQPEPDRLAELTRGQLSRKILELPADNSLPKRDKYGLTQLNKPPNNSSEDQ
jgi:integrase